MVLGPTVAKAATAVMMILMLDAPNVYFRPYGLVILLRATYAWVSLKPK